MDGVATAGEEVTRSDIAPDLDDLARAIERVGRPLDSPGNGSRPRVTASVALARRGCGAAARKLHCLIAMNKQYLARLAEVRADVHQRLHQACSYMEAGEFNRMVDRMARVHIQFEQFQDVGLSPRETGGTEREVALTQDPVPLPSVASADDLRRDQNARREDWFSRLLGPQRVLWPRDSSSMRHRNR